MPGRSNTMNLWDEPSVISGNAGRRERARRSGVVSLTVGALLTLAGCGYFHKYVLPNGDGGGSYAPPALQGRITALEAGQMTVVGEGGEMHVIPIAPETMFYKVTGGVVIRQELAVGHRVRVWFASPKAPVGAAAVVLLASLDPADDWPR